MKKFMISVASMAITGAAYGIGVAVVFVGAYAIQKKLEKKEKAK